MSTTTVQPKKVKIGVGEAIERLIKVEAAFRRGFSANAEEAQAERLMIIQALNQFELNIGFDCNDDGVPDNVDIFQQSATTSCCRLLPHDTSRRANGAGKTKAENLLKDRIANVVESTAADLGKIDSTTAVVDAKQETKTEQPTAKKLFSSSRRR